MNSVLTYTFVGSHANPVRHWGSRLGSQDPRTAVLDHVVGYIKERNPQTFVLENVRGFLTTQGES